MALTFNVSVLSTERLRPKTSPAHEQVAALSLLDSTTANYALSNAVWLFEKPTAPSVNLAGDKLATHLRESVVDALSAYPHWCGFLKAISSADGSAPPEAAHLAPHARRFGRTYVHYGTGEDPGVEFVIAKSTSGLDEVCPRDRTTSHPTWDRLKFPLEEFSAPTAIHNALRPYKPMDGGQYEPIVAIQFTELACGAVVLAVKMAHPLGDATSLLRFVRDWASVSRAMLNGSQAPALSPLFDPAKVDAAALGNIDDESPDPEIMQQAEQLSLHRYDWWAHSPESPFPDRTPDVFRAQGISPAGQSMPWSEWDVRKPVSQRIVHLTRDQVEYVWPRASAPADDANTASGSGPGPGSGRVSRHSAVLAHIWSCIGRARNQHHDPSPVYCDFVYGLRPLLRLDESFLGCPLIMVNASTPGASLCDPDNMPAISRLIGESTASMSAPSRIGAHLHRLAYELSPQRIWQAFLGQRHILLTTWARAGLYDIDFGFGGSGGDIRFADGLVAPMDGNVLIKEAPPARGPAGERLKSSQSWTASGVDVAVALCDGDMERFLQDPLLLPQVIS